MKLKKLLSMLLTVTLLLSSVSTGVFAADEADVKFGVSFQKYNEATHEILDASISEATAGDILVVAFTLENNTSKTMKVYSYSSYLTFNKDIFSGYIDVTDEDGEGPFYEESAIDMSGSSFAVNIQDDGIIRMAGATSSGIQLKKNAGTVVIGKIALKVSDSAESTVAKFEFDQSKKNFVTDKEENELKIDASVSASVTVNGVAPVLDTLTVVEGKNKLSVNGMAGDTTTVKAASKMGTDLTNTVAWGVAPADKGVTVSGGAVTASAKAAAGKYTVSAKLGDVTKTVEITVARAESTAASVSVTPAANAVEIPTEGSATAAFTAKVIDQYDDEMKSASVAWSIDPDVSGVSIDKNGVVTVSAEAKDAITGSRDFTVKAVSGGKEATAKLTVSRAAAQVGSVTVAGDKTELDVAAKGEESASAAFTATVKDQYGQTIENAVTWSISPTVSGVSIDKNGVVRASCEAAANIPVAGKSFTVKAVSGGKEGTATLTIKRAESAAAEIEISKDGAKVTDDTTTVTIPSAGDKTYTFTTAVYDQFGLKRETSAALSMELGSAANVAFADGKLTVSAGAAEADYTMTATSGKATKSITVKLANKLDAGVSISGAPASVTYGAEPFTLTAVNKSGKGGTISWSSSNESVLTVVNGRVTVVGAGEAKITATYDGDAEYYGTASVTIQVAKKEAAISGLTVASRTYDGTTAATLVTENAKVEGAVNGDTLGFTGDVTAAFADKNAGSKKAVTLSGEFALSGEKSANYTLTQPTNLTGTITAQELTVASATAQNRNYNGDTAVTITEVTFNGLVGAESVNYTATGKMDNANAGDSKKVSVSVTLTADETNYTLPNGAFETSVSIAKVAYTGSKTLTSSAKYGTSKTIELNDNGFLPEGFKLGELSVTENADVFASTGLDGTKLSYQLASVKGNVGKTATIVIPVTESTNYTAYDITVSVTVSDKPGQTLTAQNVNTTYGESFTVAVQGAETSVSYEVTSGNLTKNADNTFTATGIGEAVITATAAETDDYAAASCTISVSIAKRELVVTADSITITVGEEVPALTYSVAGFVGSDTWAENGAPTIKLVGEVKTDEVGEYDIVLEGGDAGENYTVKLVNGKLSVVSIPVIAPMLGNAVSIVGAANGHVTASTGSAVPGAVVYLTAAPNKGYELTALNVYDVYGNAVALLDLGNNRFSFVMPNTGVKVIASFGEEQQIILPLYADVTANDWFYAAVQYVTEQGLMSGTGNGFEPNLTTSRAMIWTILARLDGANTAVTGGNWYDSARQWAIDNGVSDGTDPDGQITREQFAAMLYRYAVSRGVDVSVGESTNILSYGDAASVSEYAIPAMQWACGAGIINGIGGNLEPQGSATRAQAATMLMRYLELVQK